MKRLIKHLATQVPPISRLYLHRNQLLLELATKQTEVVASAHSIGELQRTMQEQARILEREMSAAAARESKSTSYIEQLQRTVQAQQETIEGYAPRRAYENQAYELFGKYTQSPNTWPATSFTPGTKWGDLVCDDMEDVEFQYARDLLASIQEHRIPGAIVEFGVWYGKWLELLIEYSESLGMDRPILGFDSFEGLPELSEYDEGFGWSKGLFATPYEFVAKRLRVETRTNVHLIEGWFRDTITQPLAQSITEVAYARIDGDLYHSALDSLRWLNGRLSDRAILVFDDWTFNLGKGETKAFFEWAPTAPYRFEPLGFFATGHFYMRVHHR